MIQIYNLDFQISSIFQIFKTIFQILSVELVAFYFFIKCSRLQFWRQLNVIKATIVSKNALVLKKKTSNVLHLIHVTVREHLCTRETPKIKFYLSPLIKYNQHSILSRYYLSQFTVTGCFVPSWVGECWFQQRFFFSSKRPKIRPQEVPPPR